MNQLNSVLIEGKLVQEPNFDDESFLIMNRRDYEDRDGEERIMVEIKLRERQIAACKVAHLGKGRVVRIVGRLAMTGDDRMIVLAEHIEFEPVKPCTP